MKDNQDIREQIKKIRDLVNSKNPIVTEHIQEIKKTYLVEQPIKDTPKIDDRYNGRNGTPECDEEEGAEEYCEGGVLGEGVRMFCGFGR